MSITDNLLSPEAPEPTLDVLVVGAGPVGIFSAIELVFHGCKVRIIDQLANPLKQTKASGIAARSLEVLPETVVRKILATSLHVTEARLIEYARDGKGKVIAEVSLDSIATYHGIRSQEQWRTEQFLNEYLIELPDYSRDGRNMEIERPIQLVSFSQSENSVECVLKNVSTGTIERVAAKFILGCDGSSSFVRKHLGFSLNGETRDEYFLGMHSHLDNYTGNSECMDLYFAKGRDPYAPGFVFTMPMPDGGCVITCDLDKKQQQKWITGLLDVHDQPHLRQPDSEEVCEVLRERGLGSDLTLTPGTLKWLRHFRASSCQTNHYGEGRVYLAGDACHCHSPLGGQGMNMGFQDVKNIAWKLAFVAKGTCPRGILMTYEYERKGIEHRVLKGIQKARKVASSRDPLLSFIRGRGQRVAPVLLTFAPGHKTTAVLTHISQQAWTYATSMLSFEHWERPKLTLASICPLGGFRRRQNICRWAAPRIQAGDPIPELNLVLDGTLQTVLKRSNGWSLLLFEGSEAANEEMKRFIAKFEILDIQRLLDLGERLLAKADKTGYMPGISEVVVFPSDDIAQDVFGVQAQCLFLVRPDLHVGLRAEPIREGAVLRYFREYCGFSVGNYRVPVSAPRFDPLPSCINSIFIVMLLVGWYATGDCSWPFITGITVCVVVLVVLSCMSRPPC